MFKGGRSVNAMQARPIAPLSGAAAERLRRTARYAAHMLRQEPVALGLDQLADVVPQHPDPARTAASCASMPDEAMRSGCLGIS